jgi:diguanylate cyclase (GGDEF)-like protein
MSPVLGAALQLATVAGSLACAIGGVAAALRARAAARADALALRLVRAREAGFADTARRLAVAARESTAAVRDEIGRAARVAAPAIDGVLLYEDEGAALHCTAASGDRFAYFAGSRVAKGDGSSLVARALVAGHRVTLADDTVRRLHPGDVAALAAPLALDTGDACILAVASQHELDADAVERIVALADQASPAYLIALDHERDRRRAEYDGLTGLLTPRAFRQRLSALVERARFAPATELALVFADTDHFKRWNDSYGHAAGDALLRELAEVLRAAAASADLVARNGGDEFCIVFADSGKAAAIERAAQLRTRIAAIDYDALRPPGSSPEIRVTASLGVAAFPADALTASELLERADAAMYYAKATGRDGLAYLLPNGDLMRFSAGVRCSDDVSER